MLKQLLCASALTCLILPSSTLAAVPTLSGKYAFTGDNYCQPIVSGSPLVLVKNGEVDHLVGTVIFNATDMTFTFSATIESGSAIDGGGPFNEHTLTASGPYSNTSTSITINGVSSAATYGHLAKGIAEYAAFMNLNQNSEAENCSSQDQISRK